MSDKVSKNHGESKTEAKSMYKNIIGGSLKFKKPAKGIDKEKKKKQKEAKDELGPTKKPEDTKGGEWVVSAKTGRKVNVSQQYIRGDFDQDGSSSALLNERAKKKSDKYCK